MLVVAHRTPADRAACDRLFAAGARVFEIDVQVGVRGLVVSHYVPVPALPGWRRDNWRLRRATRPLPDFHSRAALVPPDAAILLDLKAVDSAERRALVAAIRNELADRERYRVSTPHAEDLDVLREAGFRTWRTARDRRSLAALLAEEVPDEAVTVRHSLLDPATVDALHGRGQHVLAWTVNTVRRARRLRAMGVDGVTTDRTGVAAAVGD